MPVKRRYFLITLLVVVGLALLIGSVLLRGPKVGSLTVTALRCDNGRNPLGVDAGQPQLGWQLTSNVRGDRQTAYQVLVDSSMEGLALNRGDLWDSGQAESDDSALVRYVGMPLSSAQKVYWKVRVWDKNRRPSPWSVPATWTMGILNEADWQGAKWIMAPGADVPERKARGYHAGETKREDDEKWVQVNLDQPLPISAVRLHPMQHDKQEGFGFPPRFRVEISNDPTFANATLVADHTRADFPNPGAEPSSFSVPGDAARAGARYVRITATKLRRRTAGGYAFALSQIEVVSSNKNVATAAAVSAKDSVETFGWGKASVIDGLGFVGAAKVEPYATTQLRRTFEVAPELHRAVIFVSGLGQYELTIDGAKVGQDLLTPGWTDYRKTCLYDTYEVTGQLQSSGRHAIGLLLGNGMYRVAETSRYKKFTGSFGPQKAIAQLRLEYNDGRVEVIVTDERWRVSPGPITYSHVYGGEDYDARLDTKGWNEPGFDELGWLPATTTTRPGGKLRGRSVAAPPIRAFEVFRPVSTRELRPGVTVYDMGQNASVIPRITVKGPAGSVVRIIPGELLKADGAISQESGGGPSYWQYTLAGAGREAHVPKFFHRGSRFQQVEVSPAPGSVELPVVESIECLMVQADSPVVGGFASSSDLFNRIWKLVRWAQRSNMHSVMTDCPHREKLGWLEEHHLNGPALRYNFDMTMLFAKAMNDMADAQVKTGLVPSIAPEYVKFGGDGDANPFRNSPEWGSAFLLVAWQQYLFSGDVELLRRHYDGMKRYVAYLGTHAQGHILDFGLGDWYDIGPKPPGPSQLTPKALTATAIYFEDATVLAKVARLLGQEDDARRFGALAYQIREAFSAKFFNPATRTYATNSQTSNAMPLVVGLVAPEHRRFVLDAIVKDVRDRGNALTSGDVGYRYLLRALADNGRSDVIHDMNNQSERPGYGMQLKRGATTLTEAWDANPSSSQNHFMLGQINEWFFHDLAGVQPDPTLPGFKRTIIKPAIVGDLKWVNASYASPYGEIQVAWSRTNSQVNLRVVVPVNTTAVIFVPSSDVPAITESGLPAATSPGIQFLKAESGCGVFEVGAGGYSFESSLLVSAQ